MKKQKFDPKQFFKVEELSILEQTIIKGGKDKCKCPPKVVVETNREQ